MKHFALIVCVAGFVGCALGSAKADESSAFGVAEKKPGSLLGIFYDLKQSQRREPVRGDYLSTVGEFLASGWDEDVLKRFFRVTRPIYATEVLIPNMGAGAAPKAFGVENVVRPQQWIVIYKGQVSPPEAGTYRFVGVADDVMAVAVNGKTVLVGNFGGWMTLPWKSPDPKGKIEGGAYSMKLGEWFQCAAGEIIDLDVLIGEYPGTAFGAWLLIEKQGQSYPEVEDPKFGKRPVLPVFQLAPHKISSEGQPMPFSTDAKPWIGHQ